MFAGIGIIVLFVMVFGVFILSGGDMGVVLHALPIEMGIIGGSAVAALIIGNNGAQLKALMGGFGKVFKGPTYVKQDFMDCILLVSKLTKILKSEGPVALEPHIEDPKASPIFSEYPKLLKDDTLIHLIADSLRLVVVSSGTLDPHAVEDVMDQSIKTHHHEAVAPADNLQGLADALPALGIVAAVLGIIKVMGSIDKPPTILGGMIGSALVGTFLGIFWLMVWWVQWRRVSGPSSKADASIYHVAKQLIIANLHGHPQPLIIEAARTSLQHANQPSFSDVFDAIRAK